MLCLKFETTSNDIDQRNDKYKMKRNRNGNKSSIQKYYKTANQKESLKIHEIFNIH